MRAENNSVVKKLKKKCPHLVDIHCLPHCFHLIAGKAAKALPIEIDDFISDIFTYFSRSPKKAADCKICKLKCKKLSIEC